MADMREYTTITEVDERGRMLMPLAIRKALNIENKRALVEMKVTLIEEETEKKSSGVNPCKAPESLLASA